MWNIQIYAEYSIKSYTYQDRDFWDIVYLFHFLLILKFTWKNKCVIIPRKLLNRRPMGVKILNIVKTYPCLASCCVHILLSLDICSILHTIPGPSVLLREPHSYLHQLPLPFAFLPATIKPFPPSSKLKFVHLLQISPQMQFSYIIEAIRYKLYILLT